MVAIQVTIGTDASLLRPPIEHGIGLLHLDPTAATRAANQIAARLIILHRVLEHLRRYYSWIWETVRGRPVRAPERPRPTVFAQILTRSLSGRRRHNLCCFTNPSFC